MHKDRDPFAVGLGQRLAAARRNAGYNQTQAAAAVGIARNYLSKVEQGDTTVAAWIVFELARFYCRPLEEIFGEPAPAGACRLTELHTLSLGQQAALLELVRKLRR